jgi:hypothetical protein
MNDVDVLADRISKGGEYKNYCVLKEPCDRYPCYHDELEKCREQKSKELEEQKNFRRIIN